MKTDDRPVSYFFPNTTNTTKTHTHASIPAPPAAPIEPLPVATAAQPSQEHHAHGSIPPPPSISPVAAPLFAAPAPASVPSFPFAASFVAPAPLGHSPSTLHARAAHELRVLDTLQESRASVAALAHQHSLNLLQSETEKLQRSLEEREQRRKYEEDIQARQRAEFIARTHAIDAAREHDRQCALAEQARLKEALHSAQLQAQHQASLLQMELERERTRAAEQALQAKHELELQKVKAAKDREGGTEVERRVKEAQEALKQQIAQREEQHAQALKLALAQTTSNAQHFDQLRDIAKGLQETTKSQADKLAAVTSDVADKIQQAAEREERALDSMAKQQAATVSALVAASSTKGPIQVQLLGLPAALPMMVAPVAQPTSHSLSLPLPMPQAQSSSPAVSGRRIGPAGHRSRSASISQSAQYSDDFDMTGGEPSARLKPLTTQPQENEDIDEEYEEDFSAASKPPTPKANMKTPLKSPVSRTIPKPRAPAPAPQPAATPADESIEFEDGLDVPSSNTTFHIAASPIPPRGAPTTYVDQGDEIEIEIEEESGTGVGGASASLRMKKAVASSSAIDEEFVIEDESPPTLLPPQPTSHDRNLSASHEYSNDDFVNDTQNDYANASFAPEEKSGAYDQPKQSTHEQQPYQESQQYDEEQLPVQSQTAAPDSPTPMLKSIDTLLSQQVALLDTRYDELTNSVKSQLSVLHKESVARGWSEREVARRKLAIKSAFQASKAQITTQRALLHTMAQQQKLAIYQQHQQLTAVRIDAARWEAKLEKLELGPSSVATTPREPSKRSLSAASSKGRSKLTSSAEDVDISFEEAATATHAKSTTTKRSSSATASSRRPVIPDVASSFESYGSSVGASFESTGTEEDGGSNPDRERLLSLQNELHQLRQTRKKQEHDPLTRSLIRQERRLQATEELAQRILKEKAEVIANTHREQRIAKRKKDVARILKEVQQLDRAGHDEEDALRSPTASLPTSSRGRSPRHRLPSPRTHRSSSSITPRQEAEEDVEVEFSEPERKSTAVKSHVSPRKNVAPVVPANGAESEEIAVSFDEDSTVQSQASSTAKPEVNVVSSEIPSDEISVSFEDETSLAAAQTPKSALTTATSSQYQRGMSSGDEIEDEVPSATADTSAPEEVEEEDVIMPSDGIGSSAHEIETEPEVEHSASYSESFVTEEKVEIEEDGALQSQTHSIIITRADTGRPASMASPDQSVEYAEDFIGASPYASGSFIQAPTSDAEIEEQSMPAGKLDLSQHSVVEDVLNASTTSQDYQADSFAVSGTSIASKPPASVAADIVENAGAVDESIAEDKNLSVSEQYDENSFIASVEMSGQQSARSTMGGSALQAAPLVADSVAESSHYSDSFHESLSPPTTNEEAVPAPVPAPSSPSTKSENEYGDSFIVADEEVAQSMASVAEEMSQSASAHQSISHDPIEPSQPDPTQVISTSVTAESDVPVDVAIPSTQLLPPASPPSHPIVDLNPPESVLESSAIPSEIEEEDSAHLTGEEFNSSYEGIIVSPKAPNRALTMEEKEIVLEVGPNAAIPFPKVASPRNNLRIADPDTVPADQDDTTSPHDRSSEGHTPPAMNKEDMVNAITLSLLQDLTQELKEESARIPAKQKKRRSARKPEADVAPVTTPVTVAQDNALVDQLEVDLLNDSLNELERIQHVKSARVPTPASPSLSHQSPPSSASTLSSPPSSTSISPMPLTHGMLMPHVIDSPLGLNPANTEKAPALEDWSLDQDQEQGFRVLTPLEEPLEFNKSMNDELDRLRALDYEKATQPVLKQSKEYVTQLLNDVFALELASVTQTRNSVSSDDPIASSRSKLLPTLSEANLARVESELASSSSWVGGIQPSDEAIQSQRVFNRLLIGAANQYIETYNASVINSDLSLTPWLHGEEVGLDSSAGPSDGGSLFPASLSLTLSHHRVRRAPGGLILSLKPRPKQDPTESDESVRARWQAIVVGKVSKKVATMNATTAHLQSAILEAANSSKPPSSSVTSVDSDLPPDSLSGSSVGPRVHLQLLLEQEVELVNDILARQMQSVEPGPAGATQRDWKKQRGDTTPTKTNKPRSRTMVDEDGDLQLDGSLGDVSLDSSSPSSSLLYSGSECDWEGGYESVESGHVVGVIADDLLQQLLGELVASQMAIEDRRYTRKLVARAKGREQQNTSRRQPIKL